MKARGCYFWVKLLQEVETDIGSAGQPWRMAFLSNDDRWWIDDLGPGWFGDDVIAEIGPAVSQSSEPGENA